jgi:hypothetical protein
MVKFVEGAPRQVVRTGPETDLNAKLSPQDVDQIAEIFQTPLTGAYTWNYAEADKKLRKLYRLGKERNWNADFDINWAQPLRRDETPILATAENPYLDWEPFVALSEPERNLFGWHCMVWTTSQFLHGEQGALLVASQLVSCAPTSDGKQQARWIRSATCCSRASCPT